MPQKLKDNYFWSTKEKPHFSSSQQTKVHSHTITSFLYWPIIYNSYSGKDEKGPHNTKAHYTYFKLINYSSQET